MLKRYVLRMPRFPKAGAVALAVGLALWAAPHPIWAWGRDPHRARRGSPRGS